MNINFIREFNELFKKVNNQGTHYFSGPRFISIIQEFDPSFLSYMQYIEYRKSKELSTSRKDYFFDILTKFDDETRSKIIDRINAEISDSEAKGEIKDEIFHNSFDSWLKIEPEKESKNVLDFNEWMLLQEKESAKVEREEVIVDTEIIESPTVLLSYSWDNEDHKNWVLNLAKRLRENGVNAIIDRYHLTPGMNRMVFMEQNIEKADKVLIIFTEQYKEKADQRNGGAGFEYSIINMDLYSRIKDNDKYLPILREGTIESSLPLFMKQFIAIDMSDNSLFEEKFNELLLSIYNKPLIDIPKIGPRPDSL